MAEKMELYRKYRPSTFDDIVGNEIAIKSLKKELENGSRVFLFTGNAGCGKTTLARILAKEVGAGELSIREINSAENRGIDTAREVMEQMRYTPTDGDALVWIFDECHQWLSPVQNAFLKALEDTPEHCYFCLCTTDPQKLIKPLVSRCSVINVKPLSDDDMAFLLKRTARAEKIKVSDEVCERICELAGGGCRKALKLLNKVLYLDDDKERLEALKSDDSVENPETLELCRLLASKGANFKKASGLLKGMDLSEPEKVRQAVMGYMNACLLKGSDSLEIVSAMQAFSNADTYRNGKFAITVAILDYFDLIG